MKKQQNPSGQSGQSGQTGQSAQPTEKEAVRLIAQAAKGSVGGQASGTAKATLVDKDGTPIAGETIVFEIDGSEVGTATTDANGVAECPSGSKLGAPLTWGKAVANGYTATYRGSKKYKPAKANAIVEPAVFG
ncbi:Ig-like domain-containing protein [Streptomyces sp. P1-3]|uniref:Ig-like domain-containing protein n=1 Tax=Streptomyces sp. P1-3 TaxID=3421658 RepID=UPI003D35CCD2